MATVSAVGTGSNTTTSTSRSGSTDLTMNDFLKLMTTQLKYQDPNDPQDTSQMTAQLAQYSTVSGISEMNTSLSTMLSEMRSSQAVNATNLVGREVMVSSDSISREAGASVKGAIETPNGATSMQVTVTDSSGVAVRKMSVLVNSPLSNFTWDGKDDDGNELAAGTYGITGLAVVAGKTQQASSLLVSKVASVTIDASNNSVTLNTAGLGKVGVSDVRQIM